MSKPLAFGLNFSKKPSASKPAPPKRKPMFGGDDDSDDDNDGGSTNKPPEAEAMTSLDRFGASSSEPKTATKTSSRSKSTTAIPSQPPKLKPKAQAASSSFGDLSSALAARKNAEAAAALDASVYEYDAVYDSLKPKKPTASEAADKERKPKYMTSLLQAAEVRKRDALIAEEKKIAREREAEGDEFAGKEKFVTEAYRKQQEENRRLEEEEKRREEEEARRNRGGGMSAFYKKLLDKDEQRHADAVKAAEESSKKGARGTGEDEKEDDEGQDDEKKDADRAKELNQKGASIAVNEDGQVVDKRQLLRGGLNLGAKKTAPVQRDDAPRPSERARGAGNANQFGRKQAMRERQSRMIEEQLAQSLKRSREEEAAQWLEVERANKSQKTEGEISSAKERYLARKRAAEEEKKRKKEKEATGADAS